MSSIGKPFKRFTAWITRKDPPGGPGPGGAPQSKSFDEARARTEASSIQGGIGPSF